MQKKIQRKNGSSSNLFNNLSLLLPGSTQESHHLIEDPSPWTQKSRRIQQQTDIWIPGSCGVDDFSEPLPGLSQQIHQPHCKYMKPIRVSHWKHLSRALFGNQRSLRVWNTLWDAGEKYFGIAQNLLWEQRREKGEI